MAVWNRLVQTFPREFGFDEGIQELASHLDDEGFPPRLGSFCKRCQFHATAEELAQGKRDGRLECLVKAASGTILDLYNSNSRKTNDLLAEGKVLLTDLETEDINFKEHPDKIDPSHRQWLQCEEARGALDGPFLRDTALQEQLNQLQYPLHFIDFETSRPALPFHAQRRPYEQLLFQFSHHQLDADGSLQHASQFLAENLDELPNFDTVRTLKSALGNDRGSILHWWDHERTVLKEVRKQLQDSYIKDVSDRDELIGFIDDLVGAKETPGRLVDLGRLTHNAIYFPGTNGSSSIKKVLPALLANSPGLREKYSEAIYGSDAGIPSLNFMNYTWVHLDDQGKPKDPYKLLGERVDDPDFAELEMLEEDGEAVANGGAAMVAYGVLQNGQLDAEATQNLRAQLLRYCELDTFAMVLVWEGIHELLDRRQPRT